MSEPLSLRFAVRGAAGGVYNVEAERTGARIRIRCDCGIFGCHHRLGLLAGDRSNLTSDNPGDLQRLAALIQDSELESALNAMVAAERGVTTTQEAIAQAERAGIEAMRVFHDARERVRSLMDG